MPIATEDILKEPMSQSRGGKDTYNYKPVSSLRDATIAPHLTKPWMKRSGQFVTKQNRIKRKNLLDIIMRFLTSLSLSIIPTARRDTETWQAAWKRRISTGKRPTNREREREGKHNQNMEEDIGCPWQQERNLSDSFGTWWRMPRWCHLAKRGDLLILSAEEAQTDFSQL